MVIKWGGRWWSQHSTASSGGRRWWSSSGGDVGGLSIAQHQVGGTLVVQYSTASSGGKVGGLSTAQHQVGGEDGGLSTAQHQVGGEFKMKLGDHSTESSGELHSMTLGGGGVGRPISNKRW